jgi:hypothetical protein
VHTLLEPRSSAVTSAVSVGIVMFFLSGLTGPSRYGTTLLGAAVAYLAYNTAATVIDVEDPA